MPITEARGYRARAAPRRGFSLLELVLVLITLATVTSVAVPRFTLASERYRLDRAAQRIVADLELARHEAQARSASRQVSFNAAGDFYSLPQTTNPDDPAQIYTVHLSAAPYDAEIRSASFGGSSVVTYDMYGRPQTGGTILVRVGARSRSVTVDADSGAASTP